MKRIKRRLSLLLVLCLILSMMPIRVEARTTITKPGEASGSDYSATYASKLDNIFQGSVALFSNYSDTYALGQSMNTDRQYSVAGKISGYQCYIYANAVYYHLFGDIPFHGSGISGYWNDSKTVLTNQSSASYDSFRNAGVGFGAYIRTTGNRDGSYSGSTGHSMIVLSYNGDSITYLDANSNGKGLVRIATETWSEFNTSHITGKSRKISHVVQCNSAKEMSVDVGTDFYAYIINTSRWKHLTNDGNNVSLRSETGAPNQVWYFERLSDGSYSIKSALNQWAMEVQDFGSHSGANVQTYPYNGNTAQQWYISGESGAYQFRAKCTNCVLDVANGSSEDGTNIQMWESNNSDAQYFQIWVLDHYTLPKPSNPWITASSSAAKVVTGTVTLDFGAENATNYTIGIDRLGTGRVVTQELPGNSYTTSFNEPGIYQIYVTCYNSAGYVDTSRISITVYHDIGTNFAAPILHKGHWKIIENAYESGYRVQTATETGFANQLWYFERQADGSYKISSCYDGRCLDVRDASSQPDTIVQTHPSNDNPAQRWYIWEEAGGYVLKPQCSDCVLDLTDNNSAIGTQIITYTYHGGAPQIWSIYRGEECSLQSPNLVVSAGTSISETTFAWNEVYGENRYDVKIWKNTAWDGDPYHVEWDATSGYSITLPAGTYQAYVDASNHFECKMSNIVTFTVKAHSHNYSYKVTQTPTTSATGTLTGSCSKCSGTTSVTLPKLNTTDYTYTVTKSATCTTAGIARYTWKTTTYGTYYFDVSVPASGHAYSTVVTAPNCIFQGYTTYTCSICGHSYKDHYTSALGHDMGPWEIMTEPTCTAGGYEISICLRCFYYDTRPVDAIGHYYTYAVTQNPTTSATGTLTGSCSNCSGTTSVTLPKLNTTDYTYTATKSATCTASGTGRYTWKTTTYGTFYFDVSIAATGHSYNYRVFESPTLSVTGTLVGNCSKCSEAAIITLPKLNSSDYNYKVILESTCTEMGIVRYTWKVETYGIHHFDVSLAPFHSLSDWVVVKEPTPYEEGIKVRSCMRCDYSEKRTIPKTGSPFIDVEEGSFYYAPVLWAVDKGITTGATADTFNPNGTCLRAQVVTFLYRADGNPEPTSTRNPFTDVKSGDFFYKPVLWAVENGITNGTTATTFGSYANCNRAAVVTFLWRAAGSPEPESTNNPFLDVKTTDFFYKPVLWAVENGITNGVDATHFGPNADCNRAQVVTFLYRAYN